MIEARLPRMIAAALIVTASLFSRRANADGKKVLFVSPSETAFSARVRAEIEAMGFEIERASTLAETTSPTTVAAARVVDSPPPRRVELWIVGATSGRLELRSVVQTSPEEDDATQTVRASEQLRAFFQPLQESTPLLPLPTPAPTAPPLSPPAVPRPSRPLQPLAQPTPKGAPRFMVSGAVAAVFEPGNPGLDLLLRGRWMATQSLGIGAIVALPVLGSTVASREGSATVSVTLIGAELSAVTVVARTLRLDVSAGFALSWLRTAGSAAAPHTDREDSSVTGLPFFGVELAPRLTPRVHLCLDGRGGFALPRTNISFAGRTVATWGQPVALLSLGLSLDF